MSGIGVGALFVQGFHQFSRAGQLGRQGQRRDRPALENLLPLAIVASAMEDSEDDDGIGTEHKENAIRKPPGQHPPHFGTTAQATVSAGVFQRPLKRGLNFGEKLFA